MYFAPELVVRESPVLLPTANPENVTAPGVAPFVSSSTMDPSLLGAATDIAPLFVTYCRGHLPVSSVSAVLDVRLVHVT